MTDELFAFAILAGVAVAALGAQVLLFRGLIALARRRSDHAAALVALARGPAALALPLLAAIAALPDLAIPAAAGRQLVHVFGLATIAAVAWGAIAVVDVYRDLAARRWGGELSEDVQARQIATRIDILSRTATTLIVLVGVALGALTFPEIRALGTTLLASAGVAGIVVGMAARPVFENLIAGIQIALAQPIRINDVVIVEGEYGRIEEIGSTFVVINIWDRRRLVLPLTYFIEKPFQNWTRTGSALTGVVMLYVDFSLDVGELRAYTAEILAASPLWDGVAQGIQVSDATDNAMQLRVLVSARNPTDLWDLRCDVRERLLGWLQANRPGALPQVRTGLPAAVRPKP